MELSVEEFGKLVSMGTDKLVDWFRGVFEDESFVDIIVLFEPLEDEGVGNSFGFWFTLGVDVVLFGRMSYGWKVREWPDIGSTDDVTDVHIDRLDEDDEMWFLWLCDLVDEIHDVVFNDGFEDAHDSYSCLVSEFR